MTTSGPRRNANIRALNTSPSGLTAKEGSALISPERFDPDPDSLHNHPAIVAAVKSGDIKRLNRLLAELSKERKSAENHSSSSSERFSD